MSFTSSEHKIATLALLVSLQVHVRSKDSPEEIEALCQQFAGTVSGLTELLYAPPEKS